MAPRRERLGWLGGEERIEHPSLVRQDQVGPEGRVGGGARCLYGGSGGGRFRGCILPLDALVVAPPAERRRVGRSRRDAFHGPQRRKLSHEQAAAIRAGAGNRSLRELAADFGVSHETVRAVLRSPAPRATVAA